MPVIVVDGRKIARKILKGLKKKSASGSPEKILNAEIPKKHLFHELSCFEEIKETGKYLGLVLVNDNPISLQFARQQSKAAEYLEIPIFHCGPHPFLTGEDLAREIAKLCQCSAVGGLTIQLPLPNGFDRAVVLNAIEPVKDPDCLNDKNKLVLSPPVIAVNKILASLNYDVSDKNVAVVGRGFLIGRPIIRHLTGKCRRLSIFDSKSGLALLKEADLVICGTGEIGLIKIDMLKSGAGVIDFGFGGDLDVGSGNLDELSFYTPRHGGTGPILTACLFENFYRLTELPNQLQ